MSFVTRALSLLFVPLLMAAATASAAPLSDEKVEELSRTVLYGDHTKQKEALAELVARQKDDIAPTLVIAMRYRRDPFNLIPQAFNSLTDAKVTGWFDAMLWQEQHPEVTPHKSYKTLKLELFDRIDTRFQNFLGGDRGDQANMDVRLEEITWGGVRVDGIPSLDNPDLIAAGDADYMLDDDLVFGVEINGDARAYPLRIMGWHEMFNETIGGVPVALAYCTLCGAGILFETQVEGRDEPLIFGSSGFLYRSNKLIFDRQTDSLWNQFTGEPVTGPLRGTGIKLKIRPVVITTWAEWRSRNPATKVLSIETGYVRDYGSGVVYKDYFGSPDLMFPAAVDESQLKQKDYVFGIRAPGEAKSWPLTTFEGGAVINDRVGLTDIVLIGDAATRTVRAYERGPHTFGGTAGAVTDESGNPWEITEDALVGQDGAKLPRVAGHVAYWFAWNGYLGG